MSAATTDVAEVVRRAIVEQLEKKRAADAGESAPAKSEPEATPRAPLVIPTGYKHVRDVLPHAKAEFAVKIFDDEHWPESLRVLIPDTDPTYEPDLEVAEAILYAWSVGDKSYVHGPAGVGKSSLIAYLCSLVRRPLVRFNMSEDVEASSYLGSLTLKAGETVWVDGAVAEAAKFGAVLLQDEMDRGTAANLMPLQWLLEDGGKLFLRDKPGTAEEKTIVPHADFRLVATGNTAGGGDDTGMFASANVLDTATLDRFKTTVAMSYMIPAKEEKMLVKKVPGLLPALAKSMVKLATLVRDAHGSNSLSCTMSPRVLISWAEKAPVFGQGVAFQRAFSNKLRESDRKVIIELYRKVFGTEPK
jgi:cobaltochelatase CobS